MRPLFRTLDLLEQTPRLLWLKSGLISRARARTHTHTHTHDLALVGVEELAEHKPSLRHCLPLSTLPQQPRLGLQALHLCVIDAPVI